MANIFTVSATGAGITALGRPLAVSEADANMVEFLTRILARAAAGANSDITSLASPALGTPPANGIKFPATQVASADPNTLDDYEEATWTPTLNGFTVVGTPSVTNAAVVKIGRLVLISATLNATTSIASTAVTSYLTALPYPVAIPGHLVCTNYAMGASGIGLIYSDGKAYMPALAASSYIQVDGWYLTNT